MRDRWVYTSVTRVAGLAGRPERSRRLDRARWAAGDFVLGRVLEHTGSRHEVESPSGRMIEVVPGDTIVGAFGVRAATLESVGDWRAIGPDLAMHALTSAGVFGRCTSHALMLPPPLALRYEGHVLVEGRRAAMADFAPEPPPSPGAVPTVLVIGTSMSAGKTTAAKAIIRRLKRRGLRVAGAKLSGVGRYRDILAMEDAGADVVLDFVDAGLPSTLCPEPEFELALRSLLARIGAAGVDVLVAEAGASPLEPYNGATVVRELEPSLRCVVLCASDPYAVVGVTAAFGLRPDLVAGVATSTDAGIRLVERLAGVSALNLLRPASHAALDELLGARLADTRVTRAGRRGAAVPPARADAAAGGA